MHCLACSNVRFSNSYASPFQNAFCERLGAEANVSRMLVVDFLHEFELGVWKTLFTHLIRVLRAASPAQNQLVAEFDKR